jgi:hypothetical protein
LCPGIYGELKIKEDKFDRKRTNFRTRGNHDQAEIEIFDIIDKATGNVTKATRTEHSNLNSLDTSVQWDI